MLLSRPNAVTRAGSDGARHVQCRQHDTDNRQPFDKPDRPDRDGQIRRSALASTQADERHPCAEPARKLGEAHLTGSTQQTPCAKGSYTDEAKQGECTPCAGGTYQDAMECKACKQGSYCAAGAAAALPCEGGSYSSATDNDKPDDCTLADPGFFAVRAPLSRRRARRAPSALSPGRALARSALPANTRTRAARRAA